MTTTTTRPIYEIAEEIAMDAQQHRITKGQWPGWWNYSAQYVDAMLGITSIDDNYGYDTARSVVLYALSSLQYWKGDTARRVKAELKSIAGIN